MAPQSNSKNPPKQLIEHSAHELRKNLNIHLTVVVPGLPKRMYVESRSNYLKPCVTLLNFYHQWLAFGEFWRVPDPDISTASPLKQAQARLTIIFSKIQQLKSLLSAHATGLSASVSEEARRIELHIVQNKNYPISALATTSSANAQQFGARNFGPKDGINVGKPILACCFLLKAV